MSRMAHEIVGELRRRLRGLSSASVGEVAALEGLLDALEAQMAPARPLDVLFEALFESAVDGIVIIDERGEMRWLNPALARMFGYLPGELLGQNVSVLMGGEDRAAHDAHIRRYLESGLARVIGRGRRVEGVRRDGTAIPFDLAVTEVPTAEGRLFGGVLRDLSDRLAVEAELEEAERRLIQSQKLEAVGTLASGIAHDFNNLLMAVLGSATVALRLLPVESESRRFVEAIRTEATRGRSLTRQLLTFGRERCGGEGVADLNGVVTDAMRLLEPFLGADVLVEVSLAEGVVDVPGEAGQWEQVVFNLVINARQAMPEGGTLRVRTWREDVRDGAEIGELAAGRYAVLQVEDEGCGMAPEIQARVFEPFFTTRAADQGTGLGLSMVYGLVKQWGGHIGLVSEPGRGTCFSVYLPLVDERRGEGPQRVVSSSPRAGRGERILLLEDEVRVRRVLHRCLIDAGYEVVECANADEAQARCDGSVDLLLTDIVLPGMAGHELAEHLLGRYRSLRVLFMSAHGRGWLVERGRLGASTPLLEKPFSDDELRQAVAAALAEPSSLNERAGKRVLLLEDHDLSRRATRLLLEDEGFEVLEARDCAAAEALVASGGVDAVVSDLGLPDGDAVEWVSRLRARQPAVGVVFVSGRSHHDPEVLRGLSIPRAVFMQKPVDVVELCGLLEQALRA